MSPSQVARLRLTDHARYAGLTDWEVERVKYEISEVSAEALIDELRARGWKIEIHAKECVL